MTLSEIIKELKAPKNQLNKFGGYKYRSCEDILEAIKPLLKGSLLNLSDEVVLIGTRYYVKATATFNDGENNYQSIAYAREPDEKKGLDSSQITGTSSSYARKYALNGLFCIDDTKDADTDEHHKQTNKGMPEQNLPTEDINGDPIDKEAATKSYNACIGALGLIPTANEVTKFVNETKEGVAITDKWTVYQIEAFRKKAATRYKDLT